jgi:hypothetical protein
LTLDSLTLEELELHRPDLVRELRQAQELQLEEMRQQVDELAAREATAQRRERILALIQEHDLPLPTSDGKVSSLVVSPQFVETLMRAPNEETARRMVEERSELVRSAWQWNGRRRARPQSRHQLEFGLMADGRPGAGDAKEFAAAIRGR